MSGASNIANQNAGHVRTVLRSEQIAATDPPAAAPSSSSPEASNWPPLREDIGLHPGERRDDGAPTWILNDPATGAYYHIGWREFEILSRWTLADADRIIASVEKTTALRITEEDVKQVSVFMEQAGLVKSDSATLLSKVRDQRNKKRRNPGGLLSEKLLFRRVPLVRPQKFLEATYPFVKVFFTRTFRWLVFGMLLAALYLISRQWSSFTASLSEAYGISGFIAVAVLLIVAKSIHELAHAYAAVRHGAKVPVMGVAFLLFWPVLFTETSDAWTITERRKRLGIAAAGITAEFTIAVAALLLWSFLDQGALRNAAGFAATSLLLLSLAFNMNPFMRFDGYFILCEMLGVDNAQTRGIALAQWQMRKLIAGVTQRDPEPHLSPRMRRSLLTYGYGSIVYRVFLYGIITVALYYMLFPIIAVPLILSLIFSFLLLPAIKEIAMWFSLASAARSRVGILRTACVIILLVSPLLIPWRTTVSFPIVYRGGDAFQVFAPEPGRVTKVLVTHNQEVSKGEPLLLLQSPELDHKLATTTLRAETLDRILDQHLTGASYREGFRVRESELAKTRSELAGVKARHARMVVKAPSDGRVTFLRDGLKPDLWVSSTVTLVQVVKPQSPYAFGYVDERDLGSITLGAEGTFWLDGLPNQTFRLSVTKLFSEAVDELDEPIIATENGGSVPTRRNDKNLLVPDTGLYKVRLKSSEADASKLPFRKTRGYAKIKTEPRALIVRIFDRVVALWRREFG